MTYRLETLEVLLPRVLPQILSCPKSMAVDALQIIASDFCKRASVWCEILQEGVSPGDRTLPMMPPKGAVVDDVLSLHLDAVPVDKTGYSATAYEIVFRAPVRQCVLATIEVKLRTARTATMIPEYILEEWGDILAFGARFWVGGWRNQRWAQGVRR